MDLHGIPQESPGEHCHRARVNLADAAPVNSATTCSCSSATFSCSYTTCSCSSTSWLGPAIVKVLLTCLPSMVVSGTCRQTFITNTHNNKDVHKKDTFLNDHYYDLLRQPEDYNMLFEPGIGVNGPDTVILLSLHLLRILLVFLLLFWCGGAIPVKIGRSGYQGNKTVTSFRSFRCSGDQEVNN